MAEDDEPDTLWEWEQSVMEADRRSLEAIRSRDVRAEYSGAPDHEGDDA